MIERRNEATQRPTVAVFVLVAGPVVFATLLVIGYIGMELSGASPLAIAPLNIAEAAGLGFGSDTLRRLEAGEDPGRLQSVRAEVISSSIRRVTALEAAVFSRRVELVRLLERRGYVTEPETRRHLACLAADLNARDIVQELAAADAACSLGAARESIERRSQRR